MQSRRKLTTANQFEDFLCLRRRIFPIADLGIGVDKLRYCRREVGSVATARR